MCIRDRSEGEFTPTDRWVCTYYSSCGTTCQTGELTPINRWVCTYFLTVLDNLSDRRVLTVLDNLSDR